MQIPKHFLITLKLTSSKPGIFFNFREENASFTSLTVRLFSGWVMLYACKYLWKLTEEEPTFFAKVGLISVKYLLKFWV